MRPQSKIAAFGIHFFFSCIVFLIFIFVLRFFWFPEPFFIASGGWQGLKIVAIVDIVLGPLLTFIIFSEKKHTSELKKDLTIILFIQLVAFMWGAQTVYNQRPIAVTFWENSFYTITYNEISEEYSEHPLLDKILQQHQPLYFVSKPTKVNDLKKLNDEVLTRKLPPFQLINRYEPADINFNFIKSQSINIHEIIEHNKSMKNSLNHILKTSNTKINKNIYIPLISRYQNIILIFHKDSSLLGYIKAPIKKI